MLKNPTTKTIAKYGLMLIYVAVFLIFCAEDYYFRYISKLTDSQYNSAVEEGRSYIVWNTATYIYTALYSTYLLVWVRIKHIAYKIFVTGLVLCNMMVILYLGFTYPIAPAFTSLKTVFWHAELYIIVGALFHADFLRRIWRETPMPNKG